MLLPGTHALVPPIPKCGHAQIEANTECKGAQKGGSDEDAWDQLVTGLKSLVRWWYVLLRLKIVV